MISIKKAVFALCIVFAAHSIQAPPALKGVLSGIVSIAKCDKINNTGLPFFIKQYGVVAVLGIEWIATIHTFDKSEEEGINRLIMLITQIFYCILAYNAFNAPSWVICAVYLLDYITRFVYICMHEKKGWIAAIIHAALYFILFFLGNVENKIIASIELVLFLVSHIGILFIHYRMLQKEKVTPLLLIGQRLEKARAKQAQMRELLNSVTQEDLCMLYPGYEDMVSAEFNKMQEPMQNNTLLTNKDDKMMAEMIEFLKKTGIRKQCIENLQLESANVDTNLTALQELINALAFQEKTAFENSEDGKFMDKILKAQLNKRDPLLIGSVENINSTDIDNAISKLKRSIFASQIHNFFLERQIIRWQAVELMPELDALLEALLEAQVDKKLHLLQYYRINIPQTSTTLMEKCDNMLNAIREKPEDENIPPNTTLLNQLSTIQITVKAIKSVNEGSENLKKSLLNFNAKKELITYLDTLKEEKTKLSNAFDELKEELIPPDNSNRLLGKLDIMKNAIEELKNKYELKHRAPEATGCMAILFSEIYCYALTIALFLMCYIICYIIFT